MPTPEELIREALSKSPFKGLTKYTRRKRLGGPELHELKTWPEYFLATLQGSKTFELRFDDRGFATGDYLVLREYDPATETYTGRHLTFLVTYLLDSEDGPWLQQGYVAMGGHLVADGVGPHITWNLDTLREMDQGQQIAAAQAEVKA